MPKLRTIQTNLSAGELSPRGMGRVDIARYQNAAKLMKNVISKTLGGAGKRNGTQYIAETKDSTKQSRLVPFIVSQDEAYMIEVGATYARFYTPDGVQVESGGLPYDLTTPYNQAQSLAFDYAQAEDAMFLFHGDVYPYRLRTFSEASWECAAAPFTALPFSELGDYYAVALTLSANTVGTGRTIAAAAPVFLASDVGRAIIEDAGVAVITAFTDTQNVTVEVKSVFPDVNIAAGWNLDSSPQTTCTPSAKDPVGTTITLTLAADGWRSTDVGKYVRINSGLCKITAYTSALIVDATIVIELTATVAAPALAWTLESAVWNSRDGYPRTGTVHEQRLVAAGTSKQPQTVWGSRSGELLDFTSGVNDDEGFAFTISGDDSQINLVNYLISGRNLMALTYGGEYSLQGGVEKPITPTNVQIRAQSPHGCKQVRPVTVGKETLFVQRAGRKVLGLGFRYDEDGYKANDLTVLAEHITQTGIVSMAFQQEPDPVVWIALDNGRLISLTLDRDLEITAWNRHETLGAVESLAVMPSGDSEQVWMIVRRSVNGSIVRYVERFQPDWYPVYGTASPAANDFPPADEPVNWGFTLDCAITQDDAAGKATWTGFDHLEGESIRVIADGVDMGEFTVTGGAFTLPRTAKRVLGGLFFAPEIQLLTPEIALGGGTVQGTAMSTNEIIVRVDNTIGCTVNGSEIIPGRIIGPDQLDTPPALSTGDFKVSKTGWAKGASDITISQDAPFPFHLLAVIRSLTVND